MTVTLSIPLPVIIAPQYFRVRYRLVGDVTWILAPNQDNDAFTLDLPAGRYQFEFTLIDGAKVCDSVIEEYEVIDTGGGQNPCIEFEGVIELNGRGYQLKITYTAALSSPCGYKLNYQPQGGALVSQSYVTLPPSPIIIAPVQNVPHQVAFYAIRCDGREVACEVKTIDPAAPVICDPATLSPVTIVSMAGGYYLKFPIAQSNPYTASFLLSYSQNDMVNTGVPDPGGTVNLAATPTTTTLYQPIQPNFNVPPVNGIQTIHYTGTFVDACGVSHKWSASLDLT